MSDDFKDLQRKRCISVESWAEDRTVAKLLVMYICVDLLAFKGEANIQMLTYMLAWAMHESLLEAYNSGR
jgi:hypothetical protein